MRLFVHDVLFRELAKGRATELIAALAWAGQRLCAPRDGGGKTLCRQYNLLPERLNGIRTSVKPLINLFR